MFTYSLWDSMFEIVQAHATCSHYQQCRITAESRGDLPPTVIYKIRRQDLAVPTLHWWADVGTRAMN